MIAMLVLLPLEEPTCCVVVNDGGQSSTPSYLPGPPAGGGERLITGHSGSVCVCRRDLADNSRDKKYKHLIYI